MKILITGGGGWLGQGIVEPLASRHTLRLMDVKPFASPHEVLVGDVTRLEDCRRAVEGMDAVVVMHMAPNPGGYETPEPAFDINVKGAANLYFAGAAAGVKRYVQISSIGVIWGHPDIPFWIRDLPPKGTDLYTLTKACQEVVAEHAHRIWQLSVAVLRIGGVVDADTMRKKSGIQLTEFHRDHTDRRDIGEAVRLALECPDIGYEVFYVAGTRDIAQVMDIEYTRRRLGWSPKYDFEWLKKGPGNGSGKAPPD